MSDPHHATASTPPGRLELRLIPVTPLQQNCSLLWDRDTRDAILVDAGGEPDVLMGALAHFGLTLKAVWLTHGHLDHAGGAADIRERTGVPVIGPHRDDQWLLDTIEDQARMYRVPGLRNVVPDRYLEEGDTLDFAGHTFEVVHTPGHTPGHVVIFCRAVPIAFVGDVLFQGSIGRTDFPRGNHGDLIASITRKLWPLGDQMPFVPGHGTMSRFGLERASNPFVGDAVTGYRAGV
jgi:glyoxylase-like metal-dependent hydrolase (beta-lactamase superfamily II)